MSQYGLHIQKIGNRLEARSSGMIQVYAWIDPEGNVIDHTDTAISAFDRFANTALSPGEKTRLRESLSRLRSDAG